MDTSLTSNPVYINNRKLRYNMERIATYAKFMALGLGDDNYVTSRLGRDWNVEFDTHPFIRVVDDLIPEIDTISDHENLVPESSHNNTNLKTYFTSVEQSAQDIVNRLDPKSELTEEIYKHLTTDDWVKALTQEPFGVVIDRLNYVLNHINKLLLGEFDHADWERAIGGSALIQRALKHRPRLRASPSARRRKSRASRRSDVSKRALSASRRNSRGAGTRAASRRAPSVRRRMSPGARTRAASKKRRQ